MSVFSKLSTPLTGAAIGTILFLFAHLALGRPLLPGPTRNFRPAQPVVIEMNPERIFTANCVACHQATGLGMPGVFPPLAGSDWVNQDPETPVRVVLMGITGSIDVAGATYNGTMPGLGNLTDEQIARVVTHVRSSFGNTAGEVDVATVQRVRAELSSRTTPWNGGAELAAQRAPR
jgi:mono/diheme cytochrome c family protein